MMYVPTEVLPASVLAKRKRQRKTKTKMILKTKITLQGDCVSLAFICYEDYTKTDPQIFTKFVECGTWALDFGVSQITLC